MFSTKCEAVATPKPIIRWQKLSLNQEIERTIESDELRLNFTKSDASSYKCVAENQLGRIEKVIQIKYYGNSFFPEFCSNTSFGKFIKEGAFNSYDHRSLKNRFSSFYLFTIHKL